MKLVVFDDYRLGVVEDHTVYDVTAALGDTLSRRPTFMNDVIADWSHIAPRIEDAKRLASAVPLANVTLLAPNPRPGQVIAAPANYHKHIAEMKDNGLSVTPSDKSTRTQGFFLKSPSSVIGPNRAIELPKGSTRRFDHESELAVIIGREARNVARADAMSYIFGYSCLMDITMRIDPAGKSEERSMRKSYETFTPLGPWIITPDEVGDPTNLHNQLWVNGEIRHDANTSELIVDIPELIELASSVVTLYPGDVIATGTPAGVGPIVAGDEVRIRIERVGEMTLQVSETATVPPFMF
jgi:2-keto-4-pentenoate hydratase/2-oxohepta-3-ene-1,7-dioic acid hydratase in catechol pathway